MTDEPWQPDARTILWTGFAVCLSHLAPMRTNAEYRREPLHLRARLDQDALWSWVWEHPDSLTEVADAPNSPSPTPPARPAPSL